MNTHTKPEKKGGLWDWSIDQREIWCRSYVTSVGWMLELHFKDVCTIFFLSKHIRYWLHNCR